jgi:Cu-Zn family superoxide dismutase
MEIKPNSPMKALLPISLPATAALLFLASASLGQAQHADHKDHPAAAKVSKAIAVLQPTQGSKVQGTITFTKSANGVKVEAKLTGLTPGLHGFHVHEFGDTTSPDGKSAGGHFNPTGHPHAGPEADKRHIGDLGNIEADASGAGTYSRVDKHLAFEGPTSILGRSVVVHAKPDDLKSQPAGEAGDRIAVGVIGVAKAD